MERLLKLGPWAIASAAFPIACDLGHLLGFDALNAVWLEVLSTPGLASAVSLAAIYTVWLVSLVLIGKLEPESDTPLEEVTLRDRHGRPQKVKVAWPKVLFFYPSIAFGLVCMMAIARATGGLGEAAAVSDGLQDTALGVALALFIAHIIIAAVDVTPRYAPGQPAHFAIVALASVIGALMLNLATALFIDTFGPDPGNPATLASATATSGSELFIATLLFVFFFAGPRFTPLARSFTWGSLLSGLGFILWELHGLLGRLDL